MKKKQNDELIFINEVPWVKEVDSWTQEQKEHKATREVLRQDVLCFIWDARRSLACNKLNVSWYKGTINAFRNVIISLSINKCCDTRVDHVHNWECGVCEECFGTGRTFLLMTTRSRGVKCAACKGNGIRNQEFEQSDFRFLMSDDFDDHLQQLHEMQTSDENEIHFAASALLNEQEKKEAQMAKVQLNEEMM